MLFSSIPFLYTFLPCVLILYFLVPGWLKNTVLLLSSLFFYAWGEPRFVVFMVITIVQGYVFGLLAEKFRDRPKQAKLYLWASAVVSLGLLGYCKYADFFISGFNTLTGLSLPLLHVALPIGISFYTFQALSYTIDVYQHKIKPTHDIVAFFAFISFFPQLVAGPIERATNLLPQFLVPRGFSYDKAVDGMRQILWGLFKKMVVADNCAAAVNLIFDEYQTLGGTHLFLGALFFTFQIYGDFSGYSDIAIGTARLFGVNLMRNFNFPYFSRDIAEFWRRWHISLTTWFRDYIYIPLGGSRCGKWKAMRNTLIIFLVSGFWHGANWTFICWGAFHALLFLPLFIMGKNRKNKDVVAQGRLFPDIKEVCQMFITFLLVVIGWIIFRAENIHQAWDYIMRMVTRFDFVLPAHGKDPLIYIAILLVVEWFQREKQFGLQIEEKGIFRYQAVRWTLYYVLFITTLLLAGQQEEFIYFQF